MFVSGSGSNCEAVLAAADSGFCAVRVVAVDLPSGLCTDTGQVLGVAVAADQLAYIYFTSGSTGAPKGAMCEHAGMLNHLYAKIDDLEIGEHTFDAKRLQVAPRVGRALDREPTLIEDREPVAEAIGLGQDLILGPFLQIHLALEVDPLPAIDLPGVGLHVDGQRIGVEQLQQRVVELRRRPGTTRQESNGFLEAVQGNPQIGALDKRSRPLLFRPGLTGCLQDALHSLEGGLEPLESAAAPI